MRFPKSLSLGIRVPSLPGLHARAMSPLLNAALGAAYWLMIVLTVVVLAAFVITLFRGLSLTLHTREVAGSTPGLTQAAWCDFEHVVV